MITITYTVWVLLLNQSTIFLTSEVNWYNRSHVVCQTWKQCGRTSIAEILGVYNQLRNGIRWLVNDVLSREYDLLILVSVPTLHKPKYMFKQLTLFTTVNKAVNLRIS